MLGARFGFAAIAAAAALIACGSDDSGTTGGTGGEGGATSSTTSTTTSSTTSTSTSTTTTTTTTTTATTTTTGTGGAGGEGGAITTATGTGGAGGGNVTSTGAGGSPPGDCVNPIAAADPSSPAGDTTGAPNNSDFIDCGGFDTGAGPELVYEVTPAASGSMSITLTITDPLVDLALYVESACGDPMTLLGCQDGGSDGETEVLTVQVTAGVPVYVYVDGYEDIDAGAFTLDIVDIPAEVDCQNYTDDDADGFVDCDDATSCQSLPECVPGAIATGGPCTLHNDCAANASDPYCLDEPGFGFPGGYCSEFCDLGVDDCSGDAICLEPNPSLASGHGICADTCVQNADCREPQYSCQDIGGPLVCLGESCGFATVAALGDNMGDTSTGLASLAGSCVGGTAPEKVFTFTPAASGNLTLTLSSAEDLGIHVRSTCLDPLSELGCVDAFGGGTNEVLVVPVTINVPVTIVVDGFSGASGAFTLNLVLN